MSPHCGPHGSGQGWLASALPLAPPKFDSWTCAPGVPTKLSADLHCSRAQGPVGLRIAPPLLGLRLLQVEGREPRPHMSQPLRPSSRGSRPASGLTLCGFPLCDGGYRPAPCSGRTGLDGSRVYRGLSTWHLQALDLARTAGMRASGQAGDPGLSQGERTGQGGRKGMVQAQPPKPRPGELLHRQSSDVPMPLSLPSDAWASSAPAGLQSPRI